MSREINEFVNAFGMGMRLMDSWELAKDRRERRRRRDSMDPNKSPEVQGVDDAYKSAGGKGSLGAVPVDQTGYSEGYGGNGTIYNMDEGYERGGVVLDNPAYLRGRQAGEVADREERGIPDLPPRMDYDENGQPVGWGSTGQADVSWVEPPVPLPPRAQTDIDSAPMTLSQDRLPPISDYPPQGRPVTPPGNARGVLPVGGGRKALNDQTRTEAYDPGLDGPGPTGGTSTTASPPPDASAATVSAPKKGSPQVPYNPTAGGEGSSSNAQDDLQRAIDGGLQFATHAFHLKGDGAALPGTDRYQASGVKALMQGVGAADPALVQQIDKNVNQIPGMKNDPGLWAVRRLEAIYRFYSRTGQTDKANKAAFELLQYSAGLAAQHGTAALQLLKGGDQQGAIQQIVRGHQMIPDGRDLKIDGNKATVIDSRTGEPVQTYQIKPQDIFNAALGLSNRSLYWDVLMNRAAATTKGRSTRTESQQDLDRARADYYRARTGQVGKGKGGAAGTSPALQQFIDKIGEIDSSRGKAPASPPGQSGARSATGGHDGDGGEPEDEDGGANGGGGAQPANAGGEGGGEMPAGTVAPAQESVVRLNPRPGRVASAVETPAPQGASSPSGAPAKFDPEGDGYDYETARAAGLAPDETGHWPSRDPRTGVLLKGRQHPTAKLGDEADAKKGYYVRKREDGRYESVNPDEAPDVEVFRDGSKYAPAARESQPVPFDRPKPGPNPYRPLLTDVAKIPGKDGVRARQLLQAKIAEYDKEASSWDKDRREYETNERRRVKEEAVRTREDQKAKMRDAYDFKPRPAERKQLMLDVGEAVDEAVKTIKTKDAEKKTKVFDNSIFVDDKVPAGTLKNLVFEVMTSNPLPDANRALGIVTELTRVDDEDESARQYKVRGRDVLGNIVVETKKYGPVHLRPKAAEDIFGIARQRAADAVARRAAPPKPSRLEAPLKSFGSAIEKRDGETPAAAAQRARRQAPASPTANLEP